MAPRLTRDEGIALYEKISNWGRWGKEDERGALNFITDKKRAAAARLVQAGVTVSLATDPAPDNPTPVTHLMHQTGFDAHEVRLMPYTADYFAISPHGHAVTHLDALCHVFWKGKMYNGFDASEVGSRGARKCAIDIASDGVVVSRGVLLDIPKIKKVEWLEPGDRIFPEDLVAAERDHRVQVEEGDVLLIRNGRARRRKSQGPWNTMQAMPGLDASCLSWLHERKIAVLGSDSASDVVPSGYEGLSRPIHIGTLPVMGVHLIDNADLDAVAATATRLGRYEFQFVMGPLILKRGTASPVNPLAIF